MLCEDEWLQELYEMPHPNPPCGVLFCFILGRRLYRKREKSILSPPFKKNIFYLQNSIVSYTNLECEEISNVMQPNFYILKLNNLQHRRKGVLFIVTKASCKWLPSFFMQNKSYLHDSMGRLIF